MPVTAIPTKTGLKKGLLPDVFTSSVFAASPSTGCAHGCVYCDGRAEKYYFDGDFATDIGVRTDLPELLARELPKIRERDVAGRRSLVSLGSGITDVYQDAGLRGTELVRGTTRRCAVVFASFDHPVLVITKSAAVVHDLDWWSRVVSRGGMVLLMTIAQANDSLRRRFEPGASPLEARWEALAAFRQAGASVGVLAMPLLPGISDDEATLHHLYERALSVEADYLMAGGLTLRPGRQKDGFLRTVGQFHPDLVASYKVSYSEMRSSGSPRFVDRDQLQRRIELVAKNYPLPFLLPHRVHSTILPRYESLYLLLSQMEEIYSRNREALPRLQAARQRFGRWLSLKRTTFRRNRSLEPTWVDGEFQDLVDHGLDELLENPKLVPFIRGVLEGRRFDPLTKTLQPLPPG